MRRAFAALATIGVVATAATAGAAALADGWWAPGEEGVVEASAEYPNPLGMVGVMMGDGPVDTRLHPFFQPIGPYGRACVTCHQPSDGMSLSAASIARRWEETKGNDPLFAAADAANCPSLPQDERASHSLVIEKGVFRIALPWPPRNRQFSIGEPEFTIEVVRDATGCNQSREHGLAAETAYISVFRRPRMVANLKYVETEGPLFNPRVHGLVTPIDPETQRRSNLNLMADAGPVSLTQQARDAVRTFLGRASPITDDQAYRIAAFERQVYVAQSRDRFGTDFAADGMPDALGPKALQKGKAGVSGDNLETPVFGSFDAWKSAAPTDEAGAFRASVARGYEVFFQRPFFIRDVAHLNGAGLGNPAKRTCSTCHEMQLTGRQMNSGWMDTGTTNMPFADEAPDLPLFKVTCSAEAEPHPYLGRVIYTHDPGRALVTGRCVDVGSVVVGQLRGLGARAPYFTSGSAANLREVVDFYDRRFNIRFSEAEKQDLVNFLSVL